MRNATFPQDQGAPLAPDKLLKETSLLYLRDALINEQYEECAQLTQTAKEYGAGQNEINEAVAEHVFQLKSGLHTEALNHAAGQPRF